MNYSRYLEQQIYTLLLLFELSTIKLSRAKFYYNLDFNFVVTFYLISKQYILYSKLLEYCNKSCYFIVIIQ